MSNEEARLLLYVFVASDGKIGELTHTYALTENGARMQLGAWLGLQSSLGRDRIEVKHWPNGFRPGHNTYWPGSILASQAMRIDESEECHANH